jgi:hypothetical protein
MFRMLAILLMAVSFIKAASAQGSGAPQKSATKTSIPDLSAHKTSGSCDLGVVAAIGDEFQVKQIGLGHLTSQPTYVPVTSWGLDDLAFERARGGARARMSVQRIPYSKEAFPPPRETRNALFRDSKAELVEMMRRVTQSVSCRRFLLISKWITPFNGSTQSVQGAGIIDWNSLLNHRTYLYALGYIRVFDGSDFTIIKQGPAANERERLLNRSSLGEPIPGPSRELDNAAFPSNPANSERNPLFREVVRTMLQSSLDRALPLALGPSASEASR